jgi:hypothetical protein
MALKYFSVVTPCPLCLKVGARRPGLHFPLIAYLAGTMKTIERMNRKQYDYFTKHESKLPAGELQLITFSFNEDERTIVGLVEEKESLIYLYEYRGKYVGTEFFISFSKASISYKLIKVGDMVN